MKVLKQNGMHILLDDEDFFRCEEHKWTLGQYGLTLATRIGDRFVTIGRFVLQYDGELEVDHKDRNCFNNQKSNLRYATRSQNGMNRRIQDNNTSGFKGVVWNKRMNRWQSQIHLNKKCIYLGCFESPIEAAKVYNNAAIKYHGEFACLNSF